MIAIPARNEAERIGACLAALHAQRAVPPFGILLLANNCSDATAPIAIGWRDRLPGLQVVCAELPPEQANAGEARRMAMASAAALVAR
jgi:glycosyltransferase involved in cell wall biosynthesis